MSQPKRIGATLDDDPKRATEIDAGIDAAWAELGALEETGRISSAQFAWIARHEPPDSAPAIVLRTWLGCLRRWVANPAEVGVDEEAFATYTCSCGEGRGWVLTDTGWRPCPRCNPLQYARWRDHWSKHPGGFCDGCRPRNYRGHQDIAVARADTAEEQREARRTAELDGLE